MSSEVRELSDAELNEGLEDDDDISDASSISGSVNESEAGTTDVDEDNDSGIDDDDDDETNSKGGNNEEEDDDHDDDEVPVSDDDEGYADTTKNKNNQKKVTNAKNKSKLIEGSFGMLGVPHGLEEGSGASSAGDYTSDDDDDDHDDDYLQKLNNNMRESYVHRYHPETIYHNYDEIQTLCRVTRNKDGIIVDDLHRTNPFMTKYERTRILGQRTKQLNEGAKPMIQVESTIIDGYVIALKELEQKKIPFIIRRPLPNGASEYWRIQDMEVL